jgi:uncharacterized protein YbaR (Trm112 family)
MQEQTEEPKPQEKSQTQSQDTPTIQPPPIVYTQQQRLNSFPIYSAPIVFGSLPQVVTCPVCKTTTLSDVVAEPGLANWLLAGVTCAVCCCLAPFAFFIDSIEDKEHYCKNCGTLLGIKKML